VQLKITGCNHFPAGEKIMPRRTASTSNLLLNGNFSQYAMHWNTTGTVDYSRQYCRALTGQASQQVNINPGASYLLRMWSQVIFKGAGAVVITSEPSGTADRIELDAFHLWTKREFNYSPPAGTTSATVTVTGTTGEVCVDEIELLVDTTTPVRPELIRNGDFIQNNADWTVERPGPASSVNFTAGVCSANLGGLIYQDIAVEPGKTYSFNLMAANPTSGDGAARLYDVANTGVILLDIELRGPETFQPYQRNFQVPAGTHQLRVLMVGITFLRLDSVSFKLA
jgi:hypothetical protein